MLSSTHDMLWLGLSLSLLIVVIVKYVFFKNKISMKREEASTEANRYAKGVQISIAFSKNMLIDPYFVNGERFYKMRVTLRYLEPLLALGILCSFFLPWTANHLSAYELVKLDNFKSTLSLMALIPLFSLLLIFLSKFFRIQTILSILFGLFSFFVINILMHGEKLEKVSLINFSHGFYIYLFFSLLLIVLPLYKTVNKTTLLNKKRIAFNSKLLKPWLAFGLLGTFFLPWLKFQSTYLSGCELLLDEAYRGSYWFVLFIPLFSIVLLINLRFKFRVKVVSFLLGISPYCVTIFGLLAYDECCLSSLNLGAYLSLLLGTGLLFLSLQKTLKNNHWFNFK